MHLFIYIASNSQQESNLFFLVNILTEVFKRLNVRKEIAGCLSDFQYLHKKHTKYCVLNIPQIIFEEQVITVFIL